VVGKAEQKCEFSSPRLGAISWAALEAGLNCSYRLLFGPLAAALFGAGVIVLPVMVPGYNFVHQTVSEIGEIGSPARIPFASMLCCVAACLLIFASGIRDISAATGRSQLTAYLIAFMAIPSAGIGIFAYPHPLHNILIEV
jgi:hypothetical protein